MDIFNVRQELKTKSIFELPLRVTFYARVSSERDEQLNSLDNQVSYYQEYINKNENWIYVDGYIDEGISGATAANRENFQKMIRDAYEDKFDLVITKEISRFARNTLDSIKYTRDLLSHGICVFFQNDNINTIDEDSELRLTIMSSIAQDELRKLSSRVKFGHAQAIKHGTVMGNSRIFGYRKENGRLVIDEEEAPMVELVFRLYSTDNYSMKQIENILYEKGYRNHNGNTISHTTLAYVIRNPKYKGYYCGNKYRNIDLFTKERKSLPEEEWVMYKDETGEKVPAIVSEEMWDAANAVLSKRSKDVKHRDNITNHNNLFTGKMYCTCCNKLYYLRTKAKGNIRARWVCSGKSKYGAVTCHSFTIFEDEMKEVIFKAVKEFIPDPDKVIEQYVNVIKSVKKNDSTQKEMNKVVASIGNEQNKQDKLLDLLAKEMINDIDFQRMNDSINKKISELSEELNRIKNKALLNSNIEKYVTLITQKIKESKKVSTAEGINRTFVESYIDKIYITPVDSKTLNIRIKLITNQEFNVNFTKIGKNNLTSSSGQISLKICPEQPMKITRYDRNTLGHTKTVIFNVKVYI